MYIRTIMAYVTSGTPVPLQPSCIGRSSFRQMKFLLTAPVVIDGGNRTEKVQLFNSAAYSYGAQVQNSEQVYHLNLSLDQLVTLVGTHVKTSLCVRISVRLSNHHFPLNEYRHIILYVICVHNNKHQVCSMCSLFVNALDAQVWTSKQDR